MINLRLIKKLLLKLIMKIIIDKNPTKRKSNLLYYFNLFIKINLYILYNIKYKKIKIKTI